jgi:hypothetical protein
MKAQQYKYRIGRLRFMTKTHVAFTTVAATMAAVTLIASIANPILLLFAGGFTALSAASYTEKIW